MSVLRLRTIGRHVASVMYFYEGEAPVDDGVITLPLDPDKVVWAQRAFLKGFRQDPETGELRSLDEILALYAVKSAESEGDDTDVADESKGPDSGGQPLDADGVRSSEPDGSPSLPEEGLASSVSNGPTARGTRKRPANKAVRTKNSR